MLQQELIHRIQDLQKTMEIQSLDAYIITTEEDIWYLTNITYKPEERPFFQLYLSIRNLFWSSQN